MQSSSQQIAYLVALDASFASREYELRAGEAEPFIIGRDGYRCQVITSGITISRLHAQIISAKDDSYNELFYLEDLGSTNGTYVNGSQITERTPLQDGDIIGLGSATIHHLCFQLASRKHISISSYLPAKPYWILGRSNDNDISIPFESVVSAYHAILYNQKGVLEIQDNNSLNGIWINGFRTKRAKISPDDTVVIGSTYFHFSLDEQGGLHLRRRECSNDVQVECVNLSFTVGKRKSSCKTILDDITVSINPGEFVGILGPSGAGKSTLLKSLNGYIRPTCGDVFFNETSFRNSYSMFRSRIGYVPQDDILYHGLTVEQSLDYTAKLRFPKDFSQDQRKDIINTTIETLGLQHVRNRFVEQLSGGQRKRVSIGSELLTKPAMLFLDEPTSGLDPSVEEKIMRLFKGMASQGTTVLITTHILYSLDLLDKIIILAQGRLVFYGTPQEAVSFFAQNQDKAIRALDIFDILESGNNIAKPELADNKAEIAQHYACTFHESRYHKENVLSRLSLPARTLLNTSCDTKKENTAVRLFARTFKLDTLKGFFPLKNSCILAERLFKLRFNSAKQAVFYTLVPVLLALVTLSQSAPGMPNAEQTQSVQHALAQQLASMTPYDELLMKSVLSSKGNADTRPLSGIVYSLQHEGVQNLPVPMSIMLMVIMAAVFLGTLSVCLEISAEKSVYERERMSGMRIVDYLASKLPVAFFITSLQCLLFIGLLWLVPNLRGLHLGSMYLIMVGVAWCSVCLGLFVSSLDPTDGRLSVILAVAAVLPQLILSGGLGPDYYQGMSQLGKTLANATPARWGLEMLFSALYHNNTSQEIEWINTFVENTVGFQFGHSALYSGAKSLLVLGSLCLLGTAILIKQKDITA